QALAGESLMYQRRFCCDGNMNRKVLVLTHSAGFVHDYLPTAQRTIQEIGKTTGEFEAKVYDDCSKVDWASLREEFSAVIFATTGELPMSEDDRESFIDSIRSGVFGFVGIHNATDTFYNFPKYGEMIGGYFSGHPWTQEVTVKIEDSDHPATEHLDKSFRVREEIYTFKDWSRSKTRVLVSLDNSSVDLSKGTRADNDYALCWCHRFGKGRVFYTGFGHFPEIWHEEWFRRHLLGGILWSMNVR
ncbi:MAG: ThuA domain-containing protein, partial [Thermoproteota archaeon]